MARALFILLVASVALASAQFFYGGCGGGGCRTPCFAPPCGPRAIVIPARQPCFGNNGCGPRPIVLAAPRNNCCNSNNFSCCNRFIGKRSVDQIEKEDKVKR